MNLLERFYRNIRLKVHLKIFSQGTDKQTVFVAQFKPHLLILPKGTRRNKARGR